MTPPAPRGQTNALSLSDSTAVSYSPAGLLWGKQLKREHAHLQSRINTLEGQRQKTDTRVTAVEIAVNQLKGGPQELERLARRLSASKKCDEESQWVSNAAIRLDRFEEDLSKATKVQQRVSALEMRFDDLETANQKAALNHGEAIRQIEDLSITVQDLDQHHERSARSNDDLNTVLLELKALKSAQNEHSKKTITMQQKIDILEENFKVYCAENLESQKMLRSSGGSVPNGPAVMRRLGSSPVGFVQVLETQPINPCDNPRQTTRQVQPRLGIGKEAHAHRSKVVVLNIRKQDQDSNTRDRVSKSNTNTRSSRPKLQKRAIPRAVLIPEGHPLKRKWVRKDLSNWI
ncbi:hypothetical protein B0J11DRAFT_615521 [Dendryphion nanum]|uniref:Uncharacterized protein n=1 Tax=Dendryphion nanum TaxID=256645 RepID=A0A9P9IJ37_9PLEO|nr:hypothetical protein B0J11DRAFT_615521 [Dendryphion nanum]